MKDQNKTKKQLINELVALRLRIAELGALENEHKRSEEALEQLAAIVQSSDDAIIGKTLGGMIISWNSGAERVYGYSSVEVIRRHISILLPPNHPDEVFQFLERISRGERIDHYETVRMRKDGQFIYVSLTISPVKDATGKIVGASTVARDISGHKRAEEALRESENKYRKIFENVQDVFYQADNEGNIIDISPSIERYSGYPREELIGKPVGAVYFNPEDRITLLKAIGEKGEVADYEVRLKSKDNRLIYTSANAHILFDSAGKPIGVEGMLKDINERKRAEEALARQHSELEILNETKDRFLGIAAHDLRNPLTVVDVSTQILKKNTTEPTHLTLLNNIGRSTQKMLALINALLDVSKIQSGKLEIRPEDVDVAQFLRECYDENEMIGRQKGIASVLSVPEDIGYARFDKERMHQAVDNLLSNAFKYSNPNTTVTLGAKRSDRGLEIRVEDQGVGIEDEDLPLLFEEFSKASAQPTGGESSHGLGLAIVKRVVELQGGRIEAKSNPGGGAVFTITLP
jgi:PAS domain S-box-containing protein